MADFHQPDSPAGDGFTTPGDAPNYNIGSGDLRKRKVKPQQSPSDESEEDVDRLDQT